MRLEIAVAHLPKKPLSTFGAMMIYLGTSPPPPLAKFREGHSVEELGSTEAKLIYIRY